METARFSHDLSVLELNAANIVANLLHQSRRVLVFGPMGSGKSTLVSQLAAVLAASQRSCRCLNADPVSPAFGIPGSISLAKWTQTGWQVSKSVALCTLDAGRFRLPLVSAVRSLLPSSTEEVLFIDAPGVVRGIAGRELLDALVEATAVDLVLVLSAAERIPALLDELRSLPLEVKLVRASTEAMRPGKRARARLRTTQWDVYLANAIEQQFDVTQLNVIGAPPPLEEPHSWIGRQVALLRDKQLLAMGEIQYFNNNLLTVTVPAVISHTDTLLIRDAVRNPEGLLETAPPYAAGRFEYIPPADVLPSFDVNVGPRIVGRVGAVDVALVNGVFGDPLLHIRVRHQRRSLLFDLGGAERLPSRLAHQVTDVFITHAHMDHIGGFLWLLRSRLGDYPACHLYGPPGLTQHIAGFISGVLWDRVQDRGPSFEVMEFYNDQLKCFRLQAGYSEIKYLGERRVNDNVLLNETGYHIRGTLLDHHGTSVMAYALEPDKQINIRKDRLKARDLQPGPWLNELKQQILTGNETAMINLPDDSTASVSTLTDELTLITPGKKLVYATDLADTQENRERLIQFAKHAHTFFCEASFIKADTDHAIRNGHLTTQACGEIATAAHVSRLVPFHFSRRYSDTPQKVYDEIEMYCQRVFKPKSMEIFNAQSRDDKEPIIELNNRA